MENQPDISQSKAYPGFWHAVLLCVLFVSLQMGFSVPLVVLDALLKIRLVTDPSAVAVVNLVSCTVVMWVAWLIGRPALSEVFTLRRVPVTAIAAVIVAGFGAIIVLSEVDNLVRVVLPVPPWISRLFQELSSPTDHLGASVVLLVVVAPVTEELIFRGLILRGFLRRFNVPAAVFLSSILFGLVHLNPWQFVSASFLGAMFAWWYTRTRSLVPSLIGHALVNAMVVAHAWLPFQIRGFNAGESFGATEFQPLWFDALGAILLVTGLLLFRRGTPPIESGAPHRSEPPPSAIVNPEQPL